MTLTKYKQLKSGGVDCDEDVDVDVDIDDEEEEGESGVLLVIMMLNYFKKLLDGVMKIRNY